MTEIRKLEERDGFRDLIELSRAFFDEYEAHHEELFRIEALSDQDIIGYFSRFLEKDGHAAFVALQDGRIVAYVTVSIQEQPGYWKVRRTGHISGLMVRGADRRQGIGAGLLERARAYFREQGVGYYTAYTAAANREAIDFYRSQGLQPLHSHLVGRL